MIPPPPLPPATTFNFGRTIADFWADNAQVDPTIAAFRVCARVAHVGDTISALLTPEGINILTGQVVATEAAQQAQRTILEQEVLIISVMVARFAGQLKGGAYPRLGSLAASPNSAARAWDVVKMTTPAEILRSTVEMLSSAFVPPADVTLVNAARRLLGRGFTYLGLTLELIPRLKHDQKNTLGIIFSAYPEEVVSLVNTINWVIANPQEFRYGFYTGIPEVRGMKQYRHLAKIVDVVAAIPTMRNFGGGHTPAGSACANPNHSRGAEGFIGGSRHP